MMQLAEKRARQLLDGEAKLIDKNAPWRNLPVSESQQKFLRWKKIPIREGMTKGEAADLIDAWKRQDEQKKAEKAARQAERMEA